MRRTLHACQKLVPDSDGGITILGYHLVGAGTGSPIDLSLEIFQRQMEELSRFAEVSELNRALERLGQSPPIQDPLVVLTFDDGYENFYDNAWPVLQEYRFPAALYVQVDFLADHQRAPIRNVGRLRPLS
ncbi:MAG: polysaccharide deacetylase family protein, partial [Thermoanaerobaculia bacterium]